MTLHWQFSASPAVEATAALAWALCAGLAALQWRRRGGGAKLAAIEGLRLLAVTLVCVALLKPEVAREIPHPEKPGVIILRDVSGSMATRDVRSPEGSVQTRTEWMAANAIPSRWQPLAATARVAVEDFGATSRSDDNAGTDVDGALAGALNHMENLKAVLLLSDGDWNAGQSPMVSAATYSSRGIPVYSIAVGSAEPLPELILAHENTPSYGLPGEQIAIPFRIQSRLPRDVSTTVILNGPDGQEAQRTVSVPAFGEVADSVIWTPEAPGDYDMDLNLPVEPEEVVRDQHDQRFKISVRPEKLKVLVVDSLPRWEYRYLRNALMRDPGVEMRTVLFQPGLGAGSGLDYLSGFPSDKGELSQYDVVFLGDVGIGDGELTEENATAIRALVEQQGSGLVLLPGWRGRENTLSGTALHDLMPVDLDATQPNGLSTPDESHLLLTAEGKGHLLTMLAADSATNAEVWKNLPGFQWCAAVSDTRPGATTLAVHSSLRNAEGRIPLLVTQPFGNGKVLFMGTDGAWRWRLGVEDRYHYRFWGQVIRWMAHQRHLAQGERIRLSFSPETPIAGEEVSLLASVFDASGYPVGKGSVSASISSGTGASEQVELAPLPGGWGVFKGTYTARTGGRLHVVVKEEPDGQQLETDLNVERASRERVGDPANVAVMRDIASLTGGAAGGTDDLDAVVRKIALLPEPHPMEQRIALWSQWYTACAVLILLAACWSARKVSGLT